MELSNKTALVTGSSYGIGRFIALSLARRGVPKIIITARSKDKLDKVAHEIKQINNECSVTVIVSDLCSNNGAQLLFQKIKESNLTVTLLINNAGIGFSGKFDEGDRTMYNDMIELNIKSTTMLIHLCISDILNQNISESGVLTISSSAGLTPFPYFSVYSATKSYLLFLSNSLAEEYESRGISISCAVPAGSSGTEFTKLSGFKLDSMRALLPLVPEEDAEKIAENSLNGFLKQRKWMIWTNWYTCLFMFIRFIVPNYILCKVLHFLMKNSFDPNPPINSSNNTSTTSLKTIGSSSSRSSTRNTNVVEKSEHFVKNKSE